ncbi:unnamed protein product [Ceutorhynchus assimilis]|uniref:CCHC-type domain-containing protein n=1 Tax=Ceutorhynchus assimilis TaxID=467358 RepID=A0A9N9QNZ0_9CUCU|nr:unnamed protein product [Ceutorhynchus assimilis]
MKSIVHADKVLQGVTVIIEDLKSHPKCPHGPTLLFSRENQRKFYACAACRDRKLCSFFLWQDELNKLSQSKLEVWEKERKKFLKGINHKKRFIMLNKIKALLPNKRTFCQTCSMFTLEHENKHVEHSLLSNITDYQLEHPSEIMPALENAKKEAQYLFSKESVQFIVNTFLELKYKHVICIGTPRIHEYIQSNVKTLSSILLDIDDRFHNFFGPLDFCWYNSFNNHFFFEEAKQVFEDFLKGTNNKDTVLITDPPFGGRIEPLAQTFSAISAQYGKNKLPMFWIFPYFMEPQILNSFSDFQMLDYKVLYDNHSLFQNGPKGRKQGSPVRIFTNISPSLIKLPNDLYKFCQDCNKWVSNENKHCKVCQDCTSKNGQTYAHCNKCRRCVKPNWQHCFKCNRCAQQDHKCGNILFSGVCLNCNKKGHKKLQCPLLNNTKKRKSKFKQAANKKLKH